MPLDKATIQSSREKSGKGFTALVVEDDVLIRGGMVRVLSNCGATVFDTDSESDAIRLLSNHPDLVVVDVQLAAGGSGVQVAESAAAMLPRPRVIAVSGRATPVQAFRLAQIGVCAYIAKPLDLTAFLATVEAAFTSAPELDTMVALQVGCASYFEVLESVRRVLVEQALAQSEGNRVHAARILRVTRQAVQQMIRDLDIER